MNTFLRTDDFDAWLSGLKDNVARARIVHRIRSAEYGNFGDCETVGEGVSEMRIHVGPGYRAYYTRRGAVIYGSMPFPVEIDFSTNMTVAPVVAGDGRRQGVLR